MVIKRQVEATIEPKKLIFRVLLGLIRIYWVLLGFIVLKYVLPNFPRFY